MYKIDETSKKLVERVLKDNDVYHISSFPISAAVQDANCVDKDATCLSYQWLYDTTGFFSHIKNYDSFIKRLAEFKHTGDYLFSLRQRMNIVQEMIECNLDSNLPVHISVNVNHKHYSKTRTLDLCNVENYIYDFIAHPGQTRLQSSVFLRDPLKNVLLYVNKDHRKYFKLKKYDFINKITDIEQLLKHYRLSSKLATKKISDAEIDFYMPGNASDIINGLKLHRKTKTFILKANNIKPLRSFKDNNDDYHASTSYLPQTFISMNSFSKIFFNNNFKIYTNNSKEATSLVHRGRESIYKRIFGDKVKDYFRTTRTALNDMSPNNNGNDCFDLWQDKYINKFLNPEEQVYAKLASNFIDLGKKKVNDGLRYEIIEVPNIQEHKSIVEKNNKRGICVLIDTNKVKDIHRDIYELLFCIPHTYTMSRTKDNSIIIINCEHEFWNNTKNFKEYIIKNEFFEPWPV